MTPERVAAELTADRLTTYMPEHVPAGHVFPEHVAALVADVAGRWHRSVFEDEVDPDTGLMQRWELVSENGTDVPLAVLRWAPAGRDLDVAPDDDGCWTEPTPDDQEDHS